MEPSDAPQTSQAPIIGGQVAAGQSHLRLVPVFIGLAITLAALAGGAWYLLRPWSQSAHQTSSPSPTAVAGFQLYLPPLSYNGRFTYRYTNILRRPASGSASPTPSQPALAQQVGITTFFDQTTQHVFLLYATATPEVGANICGHQTADQLQHHYPALCDHPFTTPSGQVVYQDIAKTGYIGFVWMKAGTEVSIAGDWTDDTVPELLRFIDQLQPITPANFAAYDRQVRATSRWQTLHAVKFQLYTSPLIPPGTVLSGNDFSDFPANTAFSTNWDGLVGHVYGISQFAPSSDYKLAPGACVIKGVHFACQQVDPSLTPGYKLYAAKPFDPVFIDFLADFGGTYMSINMDGRTPATQATTISILNAMKPVKSPADLEFRLFSG